MSTAAASLTSEAPSSRGPGIAPSLTLLVMSPLIGEVLSGATRVSVIFVLVPEIMVWGCGTLIIRELVRRWRGGWTSVLLLGFGLSIAEEFLIQQTSIAPLPWLGSHPAYGRVLGVNWPYFLFMLGYEAVWIVLVPILVTELIFPRRRLEPWLRPRGLVASSATFLAGSFVAWFLWTQRARPLVFHVPAYHPPAVTVGLGALAILLLGVAAHALRRARPTLARWTPPHPWLVVLAVLGLGFPWWLLEILVFVPAFAPPLWIPLLAGLAWGGGTYLLIRRWSSASGWRDIHRWALCFGAILVCMLGGFLGSSYWLPMDVAGKAILNVIAVIWMVWFGSRIARRSAAVDQPSG